MKTWTELRAQVQRIMINCTNVHRKINGYIYYTIGNKEYKRSDLMKLAAHVAQNHYHLSRFDSTTKI